MGGHGVRGGAGSIHYNGAERRLAAAEARRWQTPLLQLHESQTHIYSPFLSPDPKTHSWVIAARFPPSASASRCPRQRSSPFLPIHAFCCTAARPWCGGEESGLWVGWRPQKQGNPRAEAGRPVDSFQGQGDRRMKQSTQRGLGNWVWAWGDSGGVSSEESPAGCYTPRGQQNIWQGPWG